VQKNHDGSGKGESERGCENAWPIDLTTEALRKRVHTCDPICREAAEEPYQMSQHGIPRRSRFRVRREEKEVSSRPKRREDKWIASKQCQECQQSNGDEAIKSYVRCPDKCRREIGEQPIEAKPFKELEDMCWPMIGCKIQRIKTRLHHF